MAILEVKNLKKVYTTRLGGNRVEALHNVNFSVNEGEFVAIMGESGSGKTTLLNILAGLDTPTSGQVLLTGRDMTTVRESQMAAFRREHLGFVFQEFNLLDTFTVRDNIFLPLVLSGQRYADEPTGALDSRSSEELLTLFDQINGSGQTLLMVTHSVRAACYASRVLFIKDGEVFHQLYRGGDSREAMFQKINDTLTMLTTGGDAQ